MTRHLLAVLALAAGVLAQEPPKPEPLRYSGAPLKIPFTCIGQDLEEAGLNCSEDHPCTVFLELSGIESVLTRVFLSGNIHTADSTLYSILMVSEDSGQSWTEPEPRRKSTTLDQIQFIDFETGWISGANVQSLPHDPFLLVTTDGGKTWKERPVFDETHQGVIQRFWFDSKTSGQMLMDTALRHELYVTDTGGESWTIRQFSKNRIELRGGRGGDPAIRLRSDSKSKSYVIEKLQGNNWTTLSSFSIEVARCQ